MSHIVENSRPQPPTEKAYDFLLQLFQILREADYTAEVLARVFPDTTLTGRSVARMSAYRLSISESREQAHKLARFWLLREPLPKQDWLESLGSSLLEQGVECGLISEREGHCQANFDIQPALQRLVLTDPKFRHAREEDRHGVYYLGSDSYALINTVPRRPVRRSLDLFTGSGVHAILAATHADQVVGVDINPRAVEMSRANAGFNGFQERCEFLESDLFSAVEGRRFDLITANPPFVPTPDEDLALYRGGGPGGELLTTRVLKRLHEFLEPGGLMVMVTNYPVFQGVEVVEHHRAQLAAPEQFGIALIHNYLFPREMYIQMHMSATGSAQGDAKEFDRWLESYGEQGIIGVGFGVLLFQHLQEGVPWSAFKEVSHIVNQEMGEQVGDWLDGLKLFGAGQPVEGLLSFHPRVQLMMGGRTGLASLSWDNPAWPDLPLDLEESQEAYRLSKLQAFSWSDCQTELLRKLGREGALVRQA